MLNRFKNAIYGPSPPSEDVTSVRIEYEYNETILPRRIRSTLFRSPSFRDDILRDSSKSRAPISGRGVSTNHLPSDDIDVGKNRLIRRATSDRLDGSNHHGQQGLSSDDLKLNPKATKYPKFRYTRPEFLHLKTEDEILVSADHQIRPIILPRDVYSLPWRSGYAECINAGKSSRNEDQAVFYQDIAFKRVSTLEEVDESSNFDSIPMESQLPWVYFGVFDGHAGTAVAVAAAAQLHNIIGEKLRQVADLLIALEFDLDDEDDDTEEYADCVPDEGEAPIDQSAVNDEDRSSEGAVDATVAESDQSANRDVTDETSNNNNTNNADDDPEKLPKEQTNVPPTQRVANEVFGVGGIKHNKPKNNMIPCADTQHTMSPERGLPNMIDICRNNITVDSLITGALESAFCDMDALIAEDKRDYKMPGGCTAIVSLFILGKLYTCNAGDSRAIVYKNNQVIPMSFDFTPTSERERILRLGQQRPEFLGNDFTHLEFIKRPTRKDLGKQMLYKDAYMTGWSMKTITYDDLKFPLVWGEGKRSRVLATIGVTRGFGDHELKAQYGSVHIKPFLTPEPEVRVLPLEWDDSLAVEDVLIMGTDGLWDVTTNQEAGEIVRRSFNLFSDNEETRSKYRYMTAAQDLVIHSRGHTKWNSCGWRTGDDRFASLDDIAVFVIPLKQYKDEYAEWKKLRGQATSKWKRQQQEQQLSQRISTMMGGRSASTQLSNNNERQQRQQAEEPMSSATVAPATAESNDVDASSAATQTEENHNRQQHEPRASNEKPPGGCTMSSDKTAATVDGPR